MYNTINSEAPARLVSVDREGLRRGWSEWTMDPEWNDSQPIYRQLRDRIVAMIIDGLLQEGDPLPSVRSVATDTRINPLTVLKAYQQLVDEQLVEKRRGLGMFVNSGARDLLLAGEREKFLTDQWPEILATIQRLGLAQELLGAPGAPGRRREGSADDVRGSPRPAQGVPGDRRPGRRGPPR